MIGGNKMSIDEAISMAPVKEKLRNLRQHMPAQQEVIYDFGAYLADRLNPELFPQGFNTTAESALYDLQEGVDRFTRQPIRSSLVGYPSTTYGSLRMKIPQIAAAVCPKDFAEGVKDFHSWVRQNTSE